MPSISQSLRYVFFLAECPCGLEFLRSVLVLDLHVSEPVLHRPMLELVHRSVVFYPLLLFHDVTIGRFHDLTSNSEWVLVVTATIQKPTFVFRYSRKMTQALLAERSPHAEGARASALG